MRTLQRKRKNNQTGSALVGVLCVMCIFTALALSMLFAAYQVLHHSQQIMTKEQCHVLAETFSKELDKEIVMLNDSEGIRKYIKDAMTQGSGNTWSGYDKREEEEKNGPAKSEVTKHIEAEMGEETETKTGTLDIGMYWKKANGTAPYENRILVVEVTARLRGEQYQIVNEYRLQSGSSAEGRTWIWYNCGSARQGGGS